MKSELEMLFFNMIEGGAASEMVKRKTGFLAEQVNFGLEIIMNATNYLNK
jgi:hypothetical protein